MQWHYYTFACFLMGGSSVVSLCYACSREAAENNRWKTRVLLTRQPLWLLLLSYPQRTSHCFQGLPFKACSIHTCMHSACHGLQNWTLHLTSSHFEYEDIHSTLHSSHVSWNTSWEQLIMQLYISPSQQLSSPWTNWSMYWNLYTVWSQSQNKTKMCTCS